MLGSIQDANVVLLRRDWWGASSNDELKINRWKKRTESSSPGRKPGLTWLLDKREVKGEGAGKRDRKEAHNLCNQATHALFRS